jgi:hypothetical protein
MPLGLWPLDKGQFFLCCCTNPNALLHVQPNIIIPRIDPRAAAFPVNLAPEDDPMLAASDSIHSEPDRLARFSARTRAQFIFLATATPSVKSARVTFY